jgi:hypothetical protein
MRRRVNATINTLSEMFPGAFAAEPWMAHRPLMLGIDKQLVELGILQAAEARPLFRAYTRRRQYQAALAGGGARVGLDGQACGHRELILNYFRAKKIFSSGVVEGLNNKAKVTMRKAYGFCTFRIAEIALYHALGNLPEPKHAHTFY